MTATTVFTAPNVVLAVAPPTYFIPNATGVAMLTGFTGWELDFDITGISPDGAVLADVTLEFQRHAWTDVIGVAHPEGEWLSRYGARLIIGPNKQGGRTGGITGPISATDANGNPVEPYPIRARASIAECPGWTIPSVTLRLLS